MSNAVQARQKPPAGWGLLPLSSPISYYLRTVLTQAKRRLDTESENKKLKKHQELDALSEILQLQSTRSIIPSENQLLIEKIKTRDGYHVFIYPFEGRAVHEVLSALLSYRLSQIQPLSLTIAMNDYGFELLSDTPIPIDSNNVEALFSADNLRADVLKSINATEVAMRQFRDIAVISGLVIQNYPRQQKAFRGLQASAGIIFNVFADYEPEHKLYQQAFKEVFDKDTNLA